MVGGPLHGSGCCCIAALSCLLLQLALIAAMPCSPAARTHSFGHLVATRRYWHQSHQDCNNDAASKEILLTASTNSVHEIAHTLGSHEPQPAQNKPQTVLHQKSKPDQQQNSMSAAADAMLHTEYSGNGARNRGSSNGLRRHLLQPPLVLPPSLPPQVTIKELMAAADVSGDGNVGVDVKLPAISAPNTSSEGETQLPPVVVNVRISDLFPDQNVGKRRLQDELRRRSDAVVAGPIHNSSITGSSSSSSCLTISTGGSLSQGNDAVAAYGLVQRRPVRLRTAPFFRQLKAGLGRSSDSLSLVTGDSSSTGSSRHALQGSGACGKPSTSSNQGSAGQELSGYLQDNPDSTQPLQQLSGARFARLNSQQQPLALCELSNSRCNSGKRTQNPGSPEGLSFSGTATAMAEVLPGSTIHVMRAARVAAAVAHSRSLLQGLVSPAGLSNWLQTADQQEQQMVRQIMGRPSSTSSSSNTRISDVVGNSAAGGSPRKASRRMLARKHAIHWHGYDSWPQIAASDTASSVAAGGARVLQDLPGFSNWYSQASSNDQQNSQLLGLNSRGTGADTATIRSVVGGDASSSRGQSTNPQPAGGRNQGNHHKRRRLLQAAS